MGYVLVIALILGTAIFVAVEMAVFSVRSERLGIAAEKGDNRGNIVLGFLNDPPRFLSAFQIATTLTSILIGAYGQSIIAAEWQARFERVGVEAAPTWAFWATVASTTFLSLILSNLLPKQIGFVWAEEVSLLSARASEAYVRITRPLAWLLEITARGLAKLFRIPIASQGIVTEADVVYMLKEGRTPGGLDPKERQIAEKAFQLSDIPVTSAMTAREEIAWIDSNWPAPRIREFVAVGGRSYYPVCDGDLNKVKGILKARDYLAVSPLKQEPSYLPKIIQEALILPRRTKLLQVMERLRYSNVRVALVSSEGGDIIGMLTLNDLVVNLLGPLSGIK